MTIMLGMVAAVIAFRKRNGEGRLRKLQKQLKDKQPKKKMLYQWPTKKIFSIVFIVLMGVLLERFCEVF